MKLLVTYLQSIDKEKFTLLGVYSKNLKLEKRSDFEVEKSKLSQEEIVLYMEQNPYTTASHFYTEVDTNLSEESFCEMFSKKLILAIYEYGDERVIRSLSIN